MKLTVSSFFCCLALNASIIPFAFAEIREQIVEKASRVLETSPEMPWRTKMRLVFEAHLAERIRDLPLNDLKELDRFVSTLQDAPANPNFFFESLSEKYSRRFGMRAMKSPVAPFFLLHTIEHVLLGKWTQSVTGVIYEKRIYDQEILFLDRLALAFQDDSELMGALSGLVGTSDSEKNRLARLFAKLNARNEVVSEEDFQILDRVMIDVWNESWKAYSQSKSTYASERLKIDGYQKQATLNDAMSYFFTLAALTQMVHLKLVSGTVMEFIGECSQALVDFFQSK